ncbi:MAG: DUF3737 family protein [Ruminococcaceae bacterium]|nr:DUF3737 family protein [Oscillospiraceae bacterium]
MANIISNQTFDAERALYNLTDAHVVACRFEGPADGESALKEARNIGLNQCRFSLRYPLWHVQQFTMTNCQMDEKARAAIWYAQSGRIVESNLGGIKALRECQDVYLGQCTVDSPEFGWKCQNIRVYDSNIQAEYLFLDSRDVELTQVHMKGKYSFQYMENLVISDSVLDTKDAFWHSKNVTVKNSTVKGEYLAWFSDGLTMINCKIIGTQPLCYCKNLKLINCTMEGTDLAFEYSDVEADVIGHIDSVKNPRSGCITADSVGEIITEDSVMECTGKVMIR